jgi:hypothetical protein
MKLFDVPPQSFIRYADSLELYFDHIDGMYSLCFDIEGRIVHLTAFADVEVINKPDNWRPDNSV